MANVISSLSVQLGVNTGAFVRDMTKARKAVRSNSARINKFLGKTQREFKATTRSIKRMSNSIFSLKRLAVGAFVGWGVKRLADSFIETGSSMDKLRLSLDTITKGEGAEWFQKLNEWALKMPINTQKAIQAFTSMRAMGLKPTIAEMTTLVDTTSALGGGSDTLMGIARALGQIKTKGKVVTQELLQLAERGVPAFEILRDTLGLTSEQLGDIGNQGLDAQVTIDALIKGMQERFGGQSEKMQTMWAGMVESLKSYWTEFKRLVMDSGVMEYLENNLADLLAWVEELYTSGQFAEWAADVADAIIELGEDITEFVLNAVGDWESFRAKVVEVFQAVQGWVRDIMPALKVLWTTLKGLAKAFNAVGKFVGKHAAIAYTGAEQLGMIPKLETGTGPAGLPQTGLFYGHQGEIVLNPQESAQARAGGGPAGVFHFHLETLAADPATIRNAAAIFQREFKSLNDRWGGN